MTLAGKKIVIIGGSSGIGLETAALALEQGAEVVIASRSADKLRQARNTLGSSVSAYELDMADEQAVKEFMTRDVKRLDHLVVTAAQTWSGPFLATETFKARELFDSKFWGQYYAAKHAAPLLAEGGSITLFSGLVAFKPMAGSASLGAVNAAVASLGQTLALELAPLRVNVVSPGIIDTPSRAGMDDAARSAFYESVTARLPVKRVGQPRDVAQSVLYLLHNSFVTGTVLHVEGGHLLT
ncbi:SDR family oxidoreductase [Paenibacillus chitinolyticus]